MFKNLGKLILLAILLFGSITVKAQKRAFKPHIGVGVQGALSFSEVYFIPAYSQYDVDYGAIPLYNAGLVLNFMAEEYAGVQTEINYAQRGWKEVRDSAFTYKRTMEFLEIPILTHLSFGKRRLRYIINLGPYFAFHRGFRESFEKFDESVELPEYNDEDYYGRRIDNPFDLGFMVDAGIGINTSAGVFQLKARYTYGVINTYDEFPKGQFAFSRMRSLNLGFAYYYNFYFKKGK